VRVLMLSQFYPPILGGEEQHVRYLGIELTRRGHVVEVLTIATPGTEAGAEMEDGMWIHRVRTTAQRIPWIYSDPGRPHALPVPDPETAHAIGGVIERGRFDVLHAHNWIANSALGAARRCICPLVLTLHDYSHICATKRFMQRGRVCSGPGLRCLPCATSHYGALSGGPTAVANAAASLRRRSKVAAFIAVSQSVADRSALFREGVPFEVIPNFVPDELVESRSSSNPGGPLLYVGDLSRDKGIEVLIGAYRRLRDPPPLVLVGRRVDGTRIDAIAGVRVLDPVPHNEVLPLIRSARVVVVPSIWPDPCPTVVLEAMAMGRPVVAAASGGIIDMLEDGITGRLVAPENQAALGSALNDVLLAPDVATQMAEAALVSVRRFTASAVAKRIEAVYERVASPKQARPVRSRPP
jgi:glycogen synthase